jgi:methionine--tRNA ligase beta chain
VGDVEVKEKLLAAHKKYFKTIRERKEYLTAHPAAVEQILARGASLARLAGAVNLAKVKKALGLEVNFIKQPLWLDEDYARPLVSFEDFARVELRVGKVVAASAPTWSNKLIEQKVDFGALGTRIVFSAMRTWYKATDFEGKSFVYVTNIPPRKMGESESAGMILAVLGKNGVPIRWEVAGMKPGAVVG